MRVEYWPELSMETGAKASETTSQKSSAPQQSYIDQNKGYQHNTQYNDQKSYKNIDSSQEYGYKQQKNSGYDSYNNQNQGYRGRRNQDQRDNYQQQRSQNYKGHRDDGYQGRRNQNDGYQSYRNQDDGYQGRRNQNDGYQGYRNQHDGYQGHGNQNQGYQSHKNSRQNNQDYGNQGYQDQRTGDYQQTYEPSNLGSVDISSTYTPKQKNLIAQFKESLIMSGLYKEEDNYAVNVSNRQILALYK